MPCQALLTYDGSSFHSSGVQKLRVKSALLAGQAIESFRERCTDAKSPLQVRLDLVSAGGCKDFVKQATKRATQEFGKADVDHGKHAGGMSNWFLERSQFESALRLIDELQPIPVAGYQGVLRLDYELEFCFVSPESGAVLPFQGVDHYLQAEGDPDRLLGQSRLKAQFSSEHTVSSYFSLPYEEWSADAASLVRSVQEKLPFRISPKRWKRWHLNQSGSGYVGRKQAVWW